VVFECIGQGTGGKTSKSDTTTKYTNASLPFQAEKLLETLDGLGLDNLVDIAGFSFGARVAMAAACIDRSRFRRVHLTGVACDRTDYGHLAMESFKDIIQSDPSLRSFAWSILLATYSPQYLRKLPKENLEKILNHITSNNSAEGLLAILDHAEVGEESDPWHVRSMADRLNSMVVTKLCVGQYDQMAPESQVRILRDKLGGPDLDVIPNCGHAVVVESPRAWKNSVVSFLNEG
jgi:pimeloyl-ACP methyl ester carboxylesterase